MILLIKNSLIDFGLGGLTGWAAYKFVNWLNVFDLFTVKLFIGLVFAILYLIVKHKILEIWQTKHHKNSHNQLMTYRE